VARQVVLLNLLLDFSMQDPRIVFGLACASAELDCDLPRSFYPLFPPALGTPLDLSLAPSALELSVLPDILVLPSDLAPFVKVSSAPPAFAPSPIEFARTR
jgi:hypothetical protein